MCSILSQDLKGDRDLEELHKILEVYEVSRYVSFELGTISNYQYYTGIIFAGYTFGSGEAIVKGGRYDRLLTCFGKDSASIGFAFVIDQLMAALQRQKIDVPVERCVELMVYKICQTAEGDYRSGDSACSRTLCGADVVG